MRKRSRERKGNLRDGEEQIPNNIPNNQTQLFPKPSWTSKVLKSINAPFPLRQCELGIGLLGTKEEWPSSLLPIRRIVTYGKLREITDSFG